jgi:hypothetical protein
MGKSVQLCWQCYLLFKRFSTSTNVSGPVMRNVSGLDSGPVPFPVRNVSGRDFVSGPEFGQFRARPASGAGAGAGADSDPYRSAANARTEPSILAAAIRSKNVNVLDP